MASRTGRTHIQSTLQHGLWALDALGREGTLDAKGLADRLDLSLRVTYDILLTLEQEGYVSHFSGGKYGLGGRVASLQHQFAGLLALPEIVVSTLVDLHRRVDLNASVNGWYGSDIVIQRYLQSHSTLGRASPVGTGYRDYPTTRCTTKAILAFLPERELLRYLASRPQSKAIGMARPLKTELRRIAQQGYAVDSGQSDREWYGIAAVFFDEHGFPTGSFGLSGPQSQIENRSETLRREVMTAAERVSAKLGYRGVYPPPSPLFADALHQDASRVQS